MTIPNFTTKKNMTILMLCIGLVQIAGYYLAGMLASPDGSMAVPQPDTLLYCQAARRIVEGHPFSFSEGTAVSTGTTSVLYPFILAIPYALGATGDALFMAGFWLNAIFYLVFLFGWGQTLWQWLEHPRARLIAALLLALSGQPAFCAMAQSDIGCWMAVSALLAWGLSIDKPALYGPLLILSPWIRPEGMVCVIAFGIILFIRKRIIPRQEGTPLTHFTWSILGLSLLSMVGVFLFNYALTGHAQFASVANKGYFKSLPFAEAVVQTANDFLQLMNSYLLGLPTSRPRNLILPVFFSAVFIWLGLLTHAWRRPKAYSLFVLLLASAGGLLTVAQSGWQGTNYDRYLVWTLPVFILFFAEGLNTCSFRYAFPVSLIPLMACFLFFAGTLFVSICHYKHVSSIANRLHLFGEEIDKSLPSTASVATFSTCGIAYELGSRPFHHLYGFYSPIFSIKTKSAAFEILKNDPASRFDYWILSPEQSETIPSRFHTTCYGENILTGPDGYEVRRADWSIFDHARSPHVKVPPNKHLVCRVDVGHEEDEETVHYEVVDRYGRPSAAPFIVIDNISGKPALDVARLVVGGDAMTLPLQPQKETLVVMRTYPKHTQSYEHLGNNISSTYAFANPLKINVTVNDKAVPPISVTYATNGFSDISFMLPGSAIEQSPCRLTFLGDHITAGYWFYQ